MICSLWRVVVAFGMAAWGHRRQRDKSGVRYVWHLMAVAWLAFGLTGDVEAVVVGLLHDYQEDVSPALGRRRILDRFGVETMIRVGALTRHEGESYGNFVRRVTDSRDDVVVAVKIADGLHNTMPQRVRKAVAAAADPVEVERRTSRYVRALTVLLGARAWEWQRSCADGECREKNVGEVMNDG